MPTKTFALIAGLIILTLVLLFVATRMSVPQPAQVTPTPKVAASPTPTPPAYTILSLSPNPLYVGTNGRGSIQVMIDTDQNITSGVQIELSYDPSAISNVQVTPGDFFKSPLIIPQWNKVDSQTGRISHAQVLPPSEPGVKGKGIIATISFTKVAGTTLSQTTLEFMPKTAVTTLPAISGNSVLKETFPAIVYFNQTTTTQPTAIPTIPQPTQPAP